MPLFQVDAFTNQPFSGNPAAVCLLVHWPGDDWLGRVAAEMNLSETAFLVPVDNGFELRWFTPSVEVALCGHATLASAHVLYEEGIVPSDRSIRFSTQSGELVADRRGERIELDFPAEPPVDSPSPEGLQEALGVSSYSRPFRYVGRNRFDYLVEVESESILRSLTPDFRRLASVLPARGVIVTSAAADRRVDFVSRYFAPGAGIDEDPVTGSAHCCLGPYWEQKLGNKRLEAFQASARGGCVHVGLQGERVKLAGEAVTVLRGEIPAP